MVKKVLNDELCKQQEVNSISNVQKTHSVKSTYPYCKKLTVYLVNRVRIQTNNEGHFGLFYSFVYDLSIHS